MPLDPATITLVGFLIDAIRGVLGKKPKASKAIAILGRRAEAIGAFISGSEKLEAAYKAGLGIGELTPQEVAAFALVDDELVKLARAIKKKLK